ncbi:MAG TPA: geranylgeranyl reductase family protein [Gaiellaceae bacterium]|nr:geranylgeranyl reductase family protein [Gaiellaceae bacterium]
MKRFDVLVVGGGPAGSTTAWRLADAGASVLLVDKARFPRDKPCGGGVTARASRACPVDVSPVVEEEVDIVELRFRYDDTVVRTASRPVIRMTQRRLLDAFLLDAAREKGVEVREGETIDVTNAPADVVVGADGANGTTARAFGLGNGIVHGVAYEGNVPYERIGRERYARRAVVELADIPGGYGWAFAKGDHVNVGVGAWQSEGPHIREHLARVCAAHGLEPSELDSLRGHRLPLRRPGTSIAAERALLVGDAAGLIDPVSGDGMYECFVSSRLASAAILDVLAGRASTLEPYGIAVDAALAPLHRASWKLNVSLDRWPSLTWRVARTQLLWRTVEKLLLGELSAPSEQHGLARVPLRALEALGRRSHPVDGAA